MRHLHPLRRRAGASVPSPAQPASGAEGSRGEIARLFLKLGFTAFGGPAAHIAMMRSEVVERRGWLDDRRFLDLMGLVNLIPGPSSTELAIYLGYLRGGWPGLVVAGVCFIGPAMALVLALAWAYVRFGALPQTGWLLYGVKPVVVAIIAQALWNLARVLPRGLLAPLLALGVAALYLLGGNPLALLFGGGAVFAVARRLARGGQATPAAVFALPGARCWPLLSTPRPLLGGAWRLPLAAAGAAGAAVPFSQALLFLTFLKIGAILYGSGYVLLAFLRADLVHNLHWLTDRQLLDAISIGQVTPGPVFTTATFIGYLTGGWPGALLATLGIFLPSFFFVAVIHRLAARLRRSPWTALALNGVNVSALALMAGVTLQLARSALLDPLTWALALLSLAVLLLFKPNSAWLILLGGLVGLAAHSLALV